MASTAATTTTTSTMSGTSTQGWSTMLVNMHRPQGVGAGARGTPQEDRELDLASSRHSGLRDDRKVASAVLPEWHRLVKLSISLSEADVAALDEHVRQAGLPSRSAAVSGPSGH
ncbi:ribbon-helix-helix domain-containing protein [Kineococcus vitellinus]|uniref:ribbon-helix-helix domain-containing protein n=1 Tax=Kineococcus vitellinus TaxID=2696565 RepID=UPI00196A1F4B|nr:ribbon-helix-helix domain-containing protein [Kineococcus vitellinus]